MTREELLKSFTKAQAVCAPDEFIVRQRSLLWDLTSYVLEITKPEEFDNEL